MAKAASLHINAQDALKSQTLLVTITGKRRLGLRIAMGVRLIKLAARVIGCSVEVRGPFASGGEVRPGKQYTVGELAPHDQFWINRLKPDKLDA